MLVDPCGTPSGPCGHRFQERLRQTGLSYLGANERTRWQPVVANPWVRPPSKISVGTILFHNVLPFPSFPAPPLPPPPFHERNRKNVPHPKRLPRRKTPKAQQQPPEGWSFHRDPSTGHDYYLHDATHESVWAGTDGSFPGVNNAAMEGLEPLRTTERGEGGDDACADWEAGIYFAAGERPAPTAPPPLSSTLELAEGSAADEGGPKSNRIKSNRIR